MWFPLFPPTFSFPFSPGIHSSHLSFPPLTVSTVCIKRPVIHHWVRAECSSCYPSVCRLLVCQPSRIWNQSPNPETLKPSRRVRQRWRRKLERVRGRQAYIHRYTTQNKIQGDKINSTVLKLSRDHFAMQAMEAPRSYGLTDGLQHLSFSTSAAAVCSSDLAQRSLSFPVLLWLALLFSPLSLRPKYSILSQWKDLSGLYPYPLHP